MKGVLDERRTTQLTVDHSTLSREPMGTDVLYRVSLSGPVAVAWADAYRLLQSDSTAFRRLRLDPAAGIVSFLCRAVDGPTQVIDALERLDELVERVNLRVGARPPTPALRLGVTP
jgi:hypothetical protein